MVIWGYLADIERIYWDYGKEVGNYYSGMIKG